MASSAMEISARSGQEALERLQELGGVAYAQSRDASNLPLGQVQAGVAPTQAALQSLTAHGAPLVRRIMRNPQVDSHQGGLLMPGLSNGNMTAVLIGVAN